jgi:hypothetical protein
MRTGTRTHSRSSCNPSCSSGHTPLAPCIWPCRSATRRMPRRSSTENSQTPACSPCKRRRTHVAAPRTGSRPRPTSSRCCCCCSRRRPSPMRCSTPCCSRRPGLRLPRRPCRRHPHLRCRRRRLHLPGSFRPSRTRQTGLSQAPPKPIEDPCCSPRPPTWDCRRSVQKRNFYPRSRRRSQAQKDAACRARPCAQRIKCAGAGSLWRKPYSRSIGDVRRSFDDEGAGGQSPQ